MSAGAWNDVVAFGVLTLAGAYLAVQIVLRSDAARYFEARSLARRDRRRSRVIVRAKSYPAGATAGRSAAARSKMKMVPPPGRGSRRT